MRRRFATFYHVGTMLLISCLPCRAELPELFRAKEFNCGTLAAAVNHYVKLGEEAAVAEMKTLANEKEDLNRGYYFNERIGWVCRILFHPKDKEPLRAPMYGVLRLPYRSMPLESWPMYPVAASGSSYFVLSEGYLLMGRAEAASDYIDHCRRAGKFRNEPVAMPTRDQALADAKALRESAAWKAIKWTDSGQGFSYVYTEEQVFGFIQAQAERTAEGK